MSCFENLDVNGLEQVEDRLGGSRNVLESDVYLAKIKTAYSTKSSGGANAINLVLEIKGEEYKETIYITNKEGKPYFIKNDKKIPLPGFKKIDDICLLTTKVPLVKSKTEDKQYKIYSSEEGKEVTKSCPTLVDLIGKTIKVSIIKRTVNKMKKVNGSYEPTAETINENEIQHVFRESDNCTLNEAKSKKEATSKGEDYTPKFMESWLKEYKGKTINKAKKVAPTTKSEEIFGDNEDEIDF